MKYLLLSLLTIVTLVALSVTNNLYSEIEDITSPEPAVAGLDPF